METLTVYVYFMFSLCSDTYGLEVTVATWATLKIQVRLD